MKPKKLTNALLIALLCLSTTASIAQTKQLFNGKDLTGWHSDVPEKDKDPNIRPSFIVRDGLLVSMGTPGGHLITNETYQNYSVEVQYRFSAKPGNCGILVHASTPRVLYGMFPKSIEVQMMDQNAGDFWCIEEDITVPDMEVRRGEKAKWGVNGDKLRRIKKLSNYTLENPVGEWNKMVVECLNNEIKVWVNGKLANHGTNCTANSGQIALQAEGSEVEFRKVVLKPIKKLSKD